MLNTSITERQKTNDAFTNYNNDSEYTDICMTEYKNAEEIHNMDNAEEQRNYWPWAKTIELLIHLGVVAYFFYATYYFINTKSNSCTNLDDQNLMPMNSLCNDMQFCDGYGFLMLLFIFTYLGLIYYRLIKPKYILRCHQETEQLKENQCNCSIVFCKKLLIWRKRRIIKIILFVILIAAFAIYLFYETRNATHKLIGLLGPSIFITVGYLFSLHRNAIQWRTVMIGIVSQFVLGLLCIRWKIGRSIFDCIGRKIATFLSYANAGSRFVFGNQLIDDGVFAFSVLSVIFFFSLFISILYYMNIMQWVVMKMGWFLQFFLNTTVCESVNAGANIFLGMSECPLLIRPYIKLLTASELHSIMVSGFSTVSGAVLAAYLSFGASAAHLVTASVMAAPASLAFSKLFLPEVEESQTKSHNIQLEKSEDTSILDAASNGASNAINIVLSITANLIAFVAFITFINAIINWLAVLIGFNDIDFEWLFSKLFIPLAWTMGVAWKDCEIVAKVIATKTIINEFVAYERLGAYMDNNDISSHSAGIATFAICGFANPSSVGILIGTLSAMAPERRSTITSVAFRAFIAGTLVCFTSASFAGLLLDNDAE